MVAEPQEVAKRIQRKPAEAGEPLPSGSRSTLSRQNRPGPRGRKLFLDLRPVFQVTGSVRQREAEPHREFSGQGSLRG